MTMSWEQQAGQNQNVKIGNKSFKGVEQFKYLGSTLQIILPLMKKSRQWNQEMLPFSAESAVFQFAIQKHNQKIWKTVVLPIWMGFKFGLSCWERNTGWGCLRIVCWGIQLGRRGNRWGEKTTYVCTQYYLNDKIKKNEMSRARAMCGRLKRCKQGVSGENWRKETNWTTYA
jgi:hypothetical protein